MSPRLASAMTSSCCSRARSTTSRSAAHPGAPSRSKHATWSLTATQCSPAASSASAQCAATASAARAAGGAGLVPGPPANSIARGHSRVGSGSSPRTICDDRAATCVAIRSPNPTSSWYRPLLERFLQPSPRRELRDLRGRNLDLLAGRRVATLAGATVRDAELAEAGKGHFTATLQRVLDRLQNGLNGACCFLLAQLRALGDLVYEFRLRHLLLLVVVGLC